MNNLFQRAGLDVSQSDFRLRQRFIIERELNSPLIFAVSCAPVGALT